ncbi:hypothetical protein [Vogesella oryzae]|uniref:hypothetical protein n=1 Tax=Vogesella oryzae TaxID=1735285 RepID=UPI001582EBEE|nr:hypothetical protein [Vogesella oryzae]
MENSRLWSEILSQQMPTVSLNIICDTEFFTADANTAVATLWLWQQHRLPCIMESLFPEVRSLAYIAAVDGHPEAGDWLAARVVVFQLEHLMLGRDEMSLMDEINRSLRRLGAKLGLEFSSLRSCAVGVLQEGALAACGRFPLRQKQASPVVQSLQLRSDLAEHLRNLRAAMP